MKMKREAAGLIMQCRSYGTELAVEAAYCSICGAVTPYRVAESRIAPDACASKNLLDDLLRRADQVLTFLDDLCILFTNNQAEQDLRIAKVQQKIAGTFGSDADTTGFCCIRSYLSTIRKQGHTMLTALAAVFAGKPLPVA
jgi:hypothetical protein